MAGDEPLEEEENRTQNGTQHNTLTRTYLYLSTYLYQRQSVGKASSSIPRGYGLD